jgi:hypothetical protein
MSFDMEKLYQLLPAYYRVRDTEQGSSLKALLSVIVEQVAVLEEDLDQLYDDQFIETCAEWVVPYIGDLVGTRQLFVFPDAAFSQRAQVANTLAYRRRKGTAAVIEQLARDVTGWNASVVEYFRLLAATQYMNHLRPGNISTADLRKWELLERLNTPFEGITRTVDVRRIETKRGKYNIPNVGIFLWRINSYSLTRSPAFKVDNFRYLFDVLGREITLYNRPETEDEITHLAEPTNVPMPFTRLILAQYLDTYYGPGKSILIRKDGKDVLPAETSPPASPPSGELSHLITVCDLSDLEDPDGIVIGWTNMPEDKIAIDPVLGRIAFPSNQNPPTKVEVSYHYGFSAELGGGQYPRPGLANATVNVTPGGPGPSLADTIAAAAQKEIIRIDSSGKMEGDITIHLNPGQSLSLQAKSGKRPVIIGSIKIAPAKDAEVTFNGLLITGGIEVTGTEKIKLTLRHCTLVPWLDENDGSPEPPAAPAVKWLESGCSGTLILARTISGRLITGDGIDIEISDTIVDGLEDNRTALAANDDGDSAAGEVKIMRSTVIGTVYVRELELAENSIFTGIVTSERRQQGCVRFSYLPGDSSVPSRFYCQPDLAIKQAIKDTGKQVTELSSGELDTIVQEVNTWLKPCFTSRCYSQPGYMQLHAACPKEIHTGADDEAEMGVFHNLYQPQREANLRARLDEYLRFGLEAGIFYGT